jgi:hypothetical protein
MPPPSAIASASASPSTDNKVPRVVQRILDSIEEYSGGKQGPDKKKFLKYGIDERKFRMLNYHMPKDEFLRNKLR